jgi:hypothetical protein
MCIWREVTETLTIHSTVICCTYLCNTATYIPIISNVKYLLLVLQPLRKETVTQSIYMFNLFTEYLYELLM